MTLAGYPIWMFAPLLVSVVLMLLFVKEVRALTKTLGIDPQNPEDGNRLTTALFGGETRLHDLGVHRQVWLIRLAFIGENLCILLFAYLIYRAEAV